MQSQAITDFTQDEEGHWVAILACGHRQHMRHNPPLVERPWVLTSAGRATRLGQSLNCLHCPDPKRPLRPMDETLLDPSGPKDAADGR
jgi:hypothetical protein